MKKRIELMIALGAIQTIRDQCNKADVHDILIENISEEDRVYIDTLVQNIDYTGADILLAAIQMVKVSVKEIKGE